MRTAWSIMSVHATKGVAVKVWIVEYIIQYDSCTLDSIFATEDAANEYAERRQRVDPEHAWRVSEREVFEE